MLNWKEKLFYKDNFFLFQDFKEYIRTLEYQRTINYRVRDDFAWMQTEIERSQEVLVSLCRSIQVSKSKFAPPCQVRPASSM